ncbi:MAG: nuclear transport factor 2 family protein [Lentisphaeria bacterium]|nr:nuclear transport factor 2 family protein [Candidatus Neomarinimicrobiota bacterium]MCF7841770.1 nuclear transport factor 2 family protein [Lentisphaeria bacterium]
MLPIKQLMVIILISTVGGCGVEKSQTQMKAELLETDRAFAAWSVEHGAAEAFRHFLAPDAMELSPRSEPVYGRETIYQEMLNAGEDYILAWDPQDGDVAASGDLGWTWGRYTFSFQDADGIDRVNYGKYLNIWKKQPDGTWRVVVDMGNQSPAPKTVS